MEKLIQNGARLRHSIGTGEYDRMPMPRPAPGRRRSIKSLAQVMDEDYPLQSGSLLAPGTDTGPPQISVDHGVVRRRRGY